MRKIPPVAALLALLAVLTLGLVPARAQGERELVFGMSAAFTGANGELGIEYYRGLTAYLDYYNAHVGEGGWAIRVEPANDGYNPGPCFQNTVNFIVRDNVFALAGYVGTPTATHVLPLLQKFSDRHIYMLFPFTGAQPLRDEPFGRYVFNLRASYFDETRVLVNRLLDVGRSRIGVFYQSDAYGRTGWDGVRRALAAHGLRIASEAAYRRGAAFERDFSFEVQHLLAAGVDAIVVVGTYAAQAAFVRDARNAGCGLPIAGLSFTDSDKMLDLLKGESERSGRDYTADLIQSQVVPSYEETGLPGVRLYREIMGNYEGGAMPSGGEEYSPRRYSFVSFEGFLNGMLLGEMVRRMGDDPRRERIPEVMESIRDFDLGIGVDAHFGPDRHQGLDAVYPTTVREGRFRAVDSWERWRK
ncbi:Receptor family ligand binding region [Pseudodesulfovibrio hydrargyri]|uniref:Receptor family ligand binding region n=1 Tax=Pseudodesulfovibrio hydrargyri TaxID=2125990 RepID=A0A1J5NCS8_9BACT|nr:ABC transporter substrate-binding protein [Pseudodesulfovibrio hydrargyri]OIQ49521.1 Receptor family ligand binding region [Pseudodesulfovibrio hydrargyri]